MLQLAIRAGLPLIHARTSDTVNFPALLAHLAGRSVFEIKTPRCKACQGPGSPMEELRRHASEGALLWTQGAINQGVDLYDALASDGCSLVALNQDPLPPECFDAGQVPTPIAFTRAQLLEVLPEDKVDEILPGLGGLTYKEVGDLIRLAEAGTGALTLAGVLSARRSAFSQLRGLDIVSTEMSYYRPEAAVEDYVSWARPFLLGDFDHRLRPRGVLLGGQPGTGKTTAAKRIAREIGVPLLRLDLGAIKGKWVGESEGALRDALAQVDREAPCVLLLDEVEKLFVQGQDDPTSSNLLASLLWWLAEHRSQVLTVMTTNAKTALPAELWREGRIDQDLELEGLDRDSSKAFARELAWTFMPKTSNRDKEIGLVVEEAKCWVGGSIHMPQGKLEELVKKLVRAWLT